MSGEEFFEEDEPLSDILAAFLGGKKVVTRSRDCPLGFYDLDGFCRCIICPRCKQHTGNRTQGHRWRLCKVTRGFREFHFCCPADCELGADTSSNNQPV